MFQLQSELSLAFVIVAASVQYVTAMSEDTSGGCAPVQYVTIGGEGTVRCCFTDGFYVVFWYKDSYETDYLIRFSEEKGKIGPGYESGQYDIESDGTLVIKHVNVSSEATYFSIKFQTTDIGDREEYFIDVKTRVEASPPYPVINECQSEDKICFAKISSPSVLSCGVERTRPSVSLEWLNRTNKGDVNVTSSSSITAVDNIVSTSLVSTFHVFEQESLLSLMVCKAKDPHDLLSEDETIVFLSKQGDSFQDSTAIKTYIEAGTEMELRCCTSTTHLKLWEFFSRAGGSDGGDESTVILYNINLTEEVTVKKIDGFRLDVKGSLQHDSIRTADEGYYACTVDDFQTSHVTLYDVIVYVTPSPNHLVVQGCSATSYCTINVQREGKLTCALNRVRPKVKLEWVVVDEDPAIKVENVHTTESQDGDAYDIILESNFIASFSTERRVAVECRVTDEYALLFPFSERLDVLFPAREVTPEPVIITEEPPTKPRWILPVVILIVIIFGGIIVVAVYRLRRSSREADTGEGEGVPLMSREDGVYLKNVLSTPKLN